MAKSEGNKFQEDFKKSCPKGVIIERIKDVPIFNDCPFKDKNPKCKQMKVSSNPCDYIMFYSPLLFYLELKSGKSKSFSFDEKIIKEKQIEGLLKRANIPNAIPGFIFNFREVNNETYFVHILDFVQFKENTERKSIPIDVCKQIGIKIENKLKKVRYWYDLKKFINDVIGQSRFNIVLH